VHLLLRQLMKVNIVPTRKITGRVCVVYLSFFVLCRPGPLTALEGGCGTLNNAYGPYDYTNAEHRRKRLPIVEAGHFTPQVEALTSSETGSLALDLDYTLRAFPNHHRALSAMSRYQLSHKRGRNAKYYTGECYFKRAVEFKPDDAVVWYIYGIHLYKQHKYKRALSYYKRAESLELDSAELNYGLGLLYMQLRNFDKAESYARKAYRQGYPLPGLKSALKRKGYWR
jgi:tetratricopeptide (TPR) repeat protein